MQLGSAGVLERSGLDSVAAMAVPPLLEGDQDGEQAPSRVGEVVGVARRVFVVLPTLNYAGRLEPTQAA